jgi:hypothetical protein
MSTGNRTSNAATVIACLSAAVAAGSIWSASARTPEADREVAAALRRQEVALERLGEKVEGLQRLCGQPQRAWSSGPSRPSGGELTAEVIDRISSVVASRVVAAAAPAPSSAPTPDNLEAATSARNLIDSAMRDKRWTADSAQTLGLLMARLTDEDRQDLRRKLSVAINNQEIALDPRVRPF